MRREQTKNRENSCKLGNVRQISCMRLGNMIYRQVCLSYGTNMGNVLNNSMGNIWQRMGLDQSKQMTHMGRSLQQSPPKRKTPLYLRFQFHLFAILGVTKTISWAFLEEPLANLTRELTTKNFENQQCSFETKKFFLKLL